ncbi:MAG: hypothetical protein ACKVH8_20660, partial [Pirellulales bacterium]
MASAGLNLLCQVNMPVKRKSALTVRQCLKFQGLNEVTKYRKIKFDQKKTPHPTPSTSITLSCNQCNTQLSAPSKFAGKRVKCRNCQAVVTIPLRETSQLNLFQAQFEQLLN